MRPGVMDKVTAELIAPLVAFLSVLSPPCDWCDCGTCRVERRTFKGTLPEWAAFIPTDEFGIPEPIAKRVGSALALLGTDKNSYEAPEYAIASICWISHYLAHPELTADDRLQHLDLALMRAVNWSRSHQRAMPVEHRVAEAVKGCILFPCGGETFKLRLRVRYDGVTEPHEIRVMRRADLEKLSAAARCLGCEFVAEFACGTRIYPGGAGLWECLTTVARQQEKDRQMKATSSVSGIRHQPVNGSPGSTARL